MNKLHLAIGKWFYGLLAETIKGGAGAVVAGVTVAAIDPSGDFKLLTARSFILIGAVFGVHAVLAMMQYLAKSPLPEIITTTTSTIEDDGVKAKTVTTKVEPVLPSVDVKS